MSELSWTDEKPNATGLYVHMFNGVPICFCVELTDDGFVGVKHGSNKTINVEHLPGLFYGPLPKDKPWEPELR